MLSIAILLSFAPSLVFRRPKCHQSCRPASEHESPVRLLHEYPLGHFVEGIAVLPNGELLLYLYTVFI
ncbi:hypothetical protein DER46DRAFT_582177 [Fusarium sp. MPI-SDFR-AT-0072]|nr:hypothetical protein DER46DRAFT_582177 [Fusarium sp. MPI-SDFR-AT-0072]